MISVSCVFPGSGWSRRIWTSRSQGSKGESDPDESTMFKSTLVDHLANFSLFITDREIMDFLDILV